MICGGMGRAGGGNSSSSKIPSAYNVPATWCNSGSPFGYSPAPPLHATISETNLFFVGSFGGNARSIANNLPATHPTMSHHFWTNLPDSCQQTHLSHSPRIFSHSYSAHQRESIPGPHHSLLGPLSGGQARRCRGYRLQNPSPKT